MGFETPQCPKFARPGKGVDRPAVPEATSAVGRLTLVNHKSWELRHEFWNLLPLPTASSVIEFVRKIPTSMNRPLPIRSRA